MTSQLAEWNMFKNNSRRNGATRPSVDVNTNTSIADARSIDQESSGNNTHDEPMNNRLLDDDTHPCGTVFDSSWQEDDNLNIDKVPVMIGSPSAPAKHSKGRDTDVVSPPHPFSSTRRFSQATTERLKMTEARESTISSFTQLGLQSTSASEVLPDLIVDSPTTISDATLDEYDNDDFASQLELALSQQWIQGGLQEPWNELEHRDFLIP